MALFSSHLCITWNNDTIMTTGLALPPKPHCSRSFMHFVHPLYRALQQSNLTFVKPESELPDAVGCLILRGH